MIRLVLGGAHFCELIGTEPIAIEISVSNWSLTGPNQQYPRTSDPLGWALGWATSEKTGAAEANVPLIAVGFSCLWLQLFSLLIVVLIVVIKQ